MKSVDKQITPYGFEIFSVAFDFNVNETIFIPIYAKVLRFVNIVGKGLL